MARDVLITVYVDHDTKVRLAERARREDRPMSYLVRRAIEEYLTTLEMRIQGNDTEELPIQPQ
jgi:predicted transcriptional regulator